MPRLARHAALAVLALAYTSAAVPALAGEVHSLSANVGLQTDYRFRGISQTGESAAVSGGLDYRYEPLGLYLGTWASSIEFNGCGAPCTDAASMEIDFYGGIAGELRNGVSWDMGGLYYAYPDQNEEGTSEFDFVEVYGKLGYTFASAPLTPTVGVAAHYSPDFFGETGDAVYVAASLDLSLPAGFSLGGEVGWQDVEDATDYVHWRVGIGYTYEALGFDLSYQEAERDCAAVGGARTLCDATVIFTVSASFDLF